MCFGDELIYIRYIYNKKRNILCWGIVSRKNKRRVGSGARLMWTGLGPNRHQASCISSGSPKACSLVCSNTYDLLEAQAARANFLCLKLEVLFWTRGVCLVLSARDSLLRKALVFFYLKSLGVYFAFLNSDLALAILFSERTVKTLAMDFLTCCDTINRT